MTKNKKDVYAKHNSRIPIFYWILGGAYMLLILALGYRQLFLYDYYVKRGDRQTLRRVVEPGTRGDIYDRNGKILVTNKPRFSAVVYFNEIRREFRSEYLRLKRAWKASHPDESGKTPTVQLSAQARSNVLNSYVDRVNSILGSSYKLSRLDYDRHFYESPLLPFPLIKDLKPVEYAILAEKLKVDDPIQLYTGSARYYPYGAIASHAIGYVTSNFDDIDTSGIPGDDLRTYSFAGERGRAGVEKAFDAQLMGKSGAKIWVVDPSGYQYDNIAEVKPSKGKNVVTSLDIELQQVIEDAFGDRNGAAVVLDIRSGEILSIISRPSYDLNDLTPYITHAVNDDITSRGAWLNRATQGLYPPGSTFKIITACAALNSGLLTPETVKTCTGGMRVGTRIFPCNKRSGHGNLDLAGAIANSCNVYFYEAALDCGIDILSDTAKSFGLDSSTGLELKEDFSRKTIVANPEYKKKYRPYDGPWTGGDTANTSIGQGYMLQTPLQMAAFTASFARRQTRTKTSILRDPSRPSDMAYHGAKKIDLTDAQYEGILRGMVAAVERGTAKRAKVEGVSIAAKSGTAQVSVEGKRLTLAWMIAFAPVENPEIAMSVMIQGEVEGDASGGRDAGPIVRAAFEKYFRDYLLKLPAGGNTRSESVNN